MGAAEALGGPQHNVFGSTIARPSRQFRIDATAHVASPSWRAAHANPPPAPPLQGGESLTAIAARHYREW